LKLFLYEIVRLENKTFMTGRQQVTRSCMAYKMAKRVQDIFYVKMPLCYIWYRFIEENKVSNH